MIRFVSLGAILAIFLAFLAGLFWSGKIEVDGVAVGSAGEWVGGIGSAIAATVAVWSMRESLRRQEVLLSESRQASADAVTVSGPFFLAVLEGRARYQIRNGSREPVRGVELVLSVGVAEYARFGVGTLGVNEILDIDADLSGVRSGNAIGAELRFRDSRGVHWISGEAGAHPVADG